MSDAQFFHGFFQPVGGNVAGVHRTVRAQFAFRQRQIQQFRRPPRFFLKQGKNIALTDKHIIVTFRVNLTVFIRVGADFPLLSAAVFGFRDFRFLSDVLRRLLF